MRALFLTASLFTSLPAQAGITDQLKEKFMSACDSVFSPNMRTPQSVKPKRVSADHRIIYGINDNIPNSLFLYNSYDERILDFIGQADELAMAEVHLGELNNATKLIGQNFAIQYEDQSGESISEFGRLVNFTAVNQSWVESVHLETDQGQRVIIPVASIVKLHELSR